MIRVCVPPLGVVCRREVRRIEQSQDSSEWVYATGACTLMLKFSDYPQQLVGIAQMRQRLQA